MPDYSDCIVAIYAHGSYQPEGRRAIDALVDAGEAGLDAFLTVRNEPPPSDLHPRDVADTISDVLARFSEQMPDLVLDRFEAGEIGESETYWALGSATNQRSIEILIAGLKSKEKYARWAAAESLIRRSSKQAVPALIEALKDRFSLVKSAVVFAMKKKQQLRQPEALPALKRIVASKQTQKHSPGLLKAAEDVIEMIQREAK